jgi:hypothetical protein
MRGLIRLAPPGRRAAGLIRFLLRQAAAHQSLAADAGRSARQRNELPQVKDLESFFDRSELNAPK